MRSSVPPRGRTSFLHIAAVAVLLAGAIAQAQPAAETAPAPAAAKKPHKAATAKAAPAKKTASYSLGVTMGEQLKSSGVTPDLVNPQQLAQGVQDALAGKTSMTDEDRDNVRGLISSAGDANHRAAAKFLAENGKKPGVVTTQSGLQYKVVSAGNGDSPKGADEVTVNYRGTLLNGTEFDSSYKRGQPATFQVNRVIPGWTEALGLMKPGAKYQLFIPPQLAYDLRSPPGIPPGSMLLFDVELLSIKAPPPPPAAAAAEPPAAAAPAEAPKPPK